MEKFDILDINGNATGLTANKGSRLCAGQYYLGTHAYIYNSSLKFLLQQRSYSKEFLPGGWDVHLEHAIAGESSLECVCRGLFEEIGLYVCASSIKPPWRLIWEEYNHIVDVYFIQVDFDVCKLIYQNDEVISLKTVSLDEMVSLINGMLYRPYEYRHFVINKVTNLRM